MKVALVHYWFITRRGGEKVVDNILKLYPDADVYTLFYDPERYGPYLKGHNVYTSVLNYGFLRKYYQKIFPLYPLGIRSLRLRRSYDLIISSESGPAKGIKNPDNVPHICYIHSPMRYCWGFTEEYLRSLPHIIRPFARFFFNRLRKWDSKTVDNVDVYVANSRNVAQRVAKYYKREAQVIYPPISKNLFDKSIPLEGEKDTYLSFGALVSYKRIDLLIEAFSTTKRRLVIIGEGPERNRLEKLATENIEFKGALEWEQIENIFGNTKALLFPGEEDFGLIPLEVMAYGIPVIAFKKGGALETVIEDSNPSQSTGIFFEEQNREAVLEAIERFEKIENQFDPDFIRGHAYKFTEERFLQEMKELIEEQV